MTDPAGPIGVVFPMRQAPAEPSPLPPPLLLVSALVAMRKTFDGGLLLPLLQLTGSFAPVVGAISGALALPAPALAGEVAPVVGLSNAALVLPGLQLGGDLAPAVAPLGAALVLPLPLLGGSFTPAVGIDAGAWILPQVELAGAVAPVVAVSAALVLPGLLLAGSEEPAVSVTAGLALPQLQVGGSFAPVVGPLSGALALPQLQLAGTVAPAFTALAGAPVLPQVTIAGTVAPAFAGLTGALVLPQLQLGGSFTVGTSPIGAWLRMAQGTIVAGPRYSSIPEIIAASAATQATDAIRPFSATSANGLPIATCAGGQAMILPHTAGTSPTAKFGVAFWVKITTNAINGLIGCNLNPGGSTSGGGRKLEFYIDTTGRFVANVYTVGAYRQCLTPIVVTLGVWVFVTLEFDGSLATEALRLLITVNGVVQSLTYVNGGLAAVPTALNVQTGNWFLFANTQITSQPLFGSIGPNWWWLLRQLVAAERSALMGLEAPT